MGKLLIIFNEWHDIVETALTQRHDIVGLLAVVYDLLLKMSIEYELIGVGAGKNHHVKLFHKGGRPDYAAGPMGVDANDPVYLLGLKHLRESSDFVCEITLLQAANQHPVPAFFQYSLKS